MELKSIETQNFLNNLFEKKSEEESIRQNSDDDKKINFLLENNLLVNIAKLEKIGYKLSENQNKEYRQKLLLKIIDDGDSLLRDYLKNQLEFPKEHLAVYFLLNMQNRNDESSLFNISRLFNFIDKVKSGLEKDPLNSYKFNKLKEKDFINFLFNFWLESGKFHLKEINEKVTNKKKFWIFSYYKSKKQLSQDVINFKSIPYIIKGKVFFEIPFQQNCFYENIKIEDLLVAKDLLNSQKEYTKILDTNQKFLVKILNENEISKVNTKIENIIKTKYEQIEELKYNINNDKLEIMSKGIDNKDKDIPKLALKYIEEIENKSLLLFEKEIDDDMKKMINFLNKEKLPEIIEKYLNIDKEFRSSLKNIQGKTAEELLIESLIVIKESLFHLEKDINEDNLKNLSIHTRYMKSVLKK